ncbi:uncharacterized protein VTP21DRAFT_1398 [Calcarisporiella thermophila]|uniref:uncharacterized protein n=1 Tax=Calcarisporiella thermophila TaxID=911321 RepID=UPI0037425DD0
MAISHFSKNSYIYPIFAAVAVIGTVSLWINSRRGKKTKRGGKRAVLNPNEFQKFPLIEKIPISHNTAVYRFGFEHPDDILGLPIGQHISVMAEIDGKQVIRSYTPTSSDDNPGYFDLLVKSYPTGNISKLIGKLKLGDTINVRGPKGAFIYTPNMCRSLGMLAGGTGITPMLQIIHAILKNPADTTQVSLIFANVTEADILLRAELDELASKHDQFRVYYTLNEPPEGWTGGVGFISEEMIRERCPAPAEDIKILVCGPPPMVSAMSKLLTDIGYEKPRAVSKLTDQVFKF